MPALGQIQPLAQGGTCTIRWQSCANDTWKLWIMLSCCCSRSQFLTELQKRLGLEGRGCHTFQDVESLILLTVLCMCLCCRLNNIALWTLKGTTQLFANGIQSYTLFQSLRRWVVRIFSSYHVFISLVKTGCSGELKYLNIKFCLLSFGLFLIFNSWVCQTFLEVLVRPEFRHTALLWWSYGNPVNTQNVGLLGSFAPGVRMCKPFLFYIYI